MKNHEMEDRLRPFVLDALIARSGKSLAPDLVAEITKEIVDRIMDLMVFFNQQGALEHE